jgi:integrase
MLHSGCRGGEAAILRTCDLDRSGPVWTFRPMFHKTEKHEIERTILVGPEGQRVLGPWLDGSNPTAYCFSPKKAHELKLAERAAARKTPRWRSHVKRNVAKRIPDSHKKRKPGERYTVAVIDRSIYRACDRIDARLRREANRGDARKSESLKPEERLFPRWSLHRVRHTAAGRLRKQFGVELCRIVLGNAHVSTSELYAEADTEQAKLAMLRSG